MSVNSAFFAPLPDTEELVAETLTVYTPGAAAFPDTASVFASYFSPFGRPDTVSFGSESDFTHAPRSSEYEPSAAVVAFVTITSREFESSSAVAKRAYA